MDVDVYAQWLMPPGYRVEVPGGDPLVVLEVSTMGGGEVGRAYGGTGWVWRMIVDGVTAASGDELRSVEAAGHAVMARRLAGFLAEEGAGGDDVARRLAVFAECDPPEATHGPPIPAPKDYWPGM